MFQDPALPSSVSPHRLSFAFTAEAVAHELSVTSFRCNEAMFECFDCVVDVACAEPRLDLVALLDTAACLELHGEAGAPRYFHGVITEAEKSGDGLRRSHYRLTLRPKLGRLQFQSDCRVFQKQTVQEISSAILLQSGVANVDWRLVGHHVAREYCVQYGETHYDFLRRIWAEEGIFFWFEHNRSGHRLVLSDAALSSPPIEGDVTVAFNGMPGGMTREQVVTGFRQIARVRATRRVANDYTFKNPNCNQRHAAALHGGQLPDAPDYELYHYPGRHKQTETGQAFNRHALDAHRVDATVGEGTTTCFRFAVGHVFHLSDHPDTAANGPHRLLKIEHIGAQATSLQEDAPDDAETTYSAAFTSQPSRLPYRPVNPTPKPVVEGPLVGVVTGPEGEEIYCDNFGRVKVWFPWDRHGTPDENSSCWIRVSQNWAGGNRGGVAIPRVGDEVLVDFLSGDPDQPIITGRMYDATKPVAYKLPDSKTKTVIRSATHRGDGFNEISFDDENGHEQMLFYAQRKRLDIVGNASLSIQTQSPGLQGATEMTAMGGFVAGMSMIFAGLVPIAGPSGITAGASIATAAVEVAKRRR